MKNSGFRPSTPAELTRVNERISFIYLEHCTIGRDANALTATDERGVIHIPSASLSVLLLGPGTRVTHQAMTVIADSGASVVWCGENGVRYYAHGRPIGRNTTLLVKQAQLVSHTRSRLAVARAMYKMRFDDEAVDNLTMQQLRGKEGARVRNIYRQWADNTGVQWNKRTYNPEDFFDSDLINQALSSAHISLYGLVHSVIVALGLSPGLGFIHTGHDRSFVYDIADLYKAEISIPIAFESVAAVEAGKVSPGDLPQYVRRQCRDAFKTNKILPRIVSDLKELLLDDSETSSDSFSIENKVIELWDEKLERVSGGYNWDDSSGDDYP